MKFRRPAGCSVRFALLGLGALVGASAIAAYKIYEITVTAARLGIKAVTTKVVGHSQTTGAPQERITLTWSVPFTDLDLSSQSGATELDKRINARALAVCKELDKLFPLSPAGGTECVKEAVNAAMPQAKKAIAAAQQTHATPAAK